MADTGSKQANNDLQIFRDRFKLTMQDKPKQFLGMNIGMRKDGGVKISASAYVKAKTETYLPKSMDLIRREKIPQIKLAEKKMRLI
eukprot:4622997-Pleurochrysis_carterae.AAC.1